MASGRAADALLWMMLKEQALNITRYIRIEAACYYSIEGVRLLRQFPAAAKLTMLELFGISSDNVRDWWRGARSLTR